MPPTEPTAALRTALHDTLATVAFLRSVIASGERLSAEDETRMREVCETARAALATSQADDPSERRLCMHGVDTSEECPECGFAFVPPSLTPNPSDEEWKTWNDAPPSCLGCGRATPTFATQSLTYPAFGLCQRCVRAIRQADDPSGPDALDVERLERALVTLATRDDPLGPDEVIVSIALEPNDPAILAGDIAEAYRAALRESPDGE